MSPEDNDPTVATERADSTVITLTGELDANDVDGLRPQFERIGEGAGWVVVDVSAVSFMDSSVLGLLVAARTEAVEAGRQVCLVGATRNVLRLFSVTNLDSVFPMFETLSDVPEFTG